MGRQLTELARHKGATLGVAAFATVSIVLTLMVAGTLSRSAGGDTITVTALFRDATGLRSGDDVRLAGVRQVWFRYVTQPQTAPEFYSGGNQNVAIQGIVTSLELHGNGGFLTVETTRGETVNMRFDYARLHSGIDLLLNKAPWMVGRSVRVLYRLSSIQNDRALREVRDIQLVR